jgi:phage recombination protein Bet
MLIVVLPIRKGFAMTTTLMRIAQATGYDQTKIELIKETIARGASDDELMLFLHLANRSGLDPFSRQIYLIERRSQVNGEWKTTRQPQTGIDGFRLIADRTGSYAPGRAPTYEYDEKGFLLSATAYVKKWVRGEWHEVAATAHYDEYVQKKRDGSPNQMWAEKPHIMLAKCAEALALRRAFPAELSGLYTPDEIPEERALAPAIDRATGEVIDVTPPNRVGEVVTLNGSVSAVEARYNTKGQLIVRFNLDNQVNNHTVLLTDAEDMFIHLADGDAVTVTGDIQHSEKIGDHIRVRTIEADMRTLHKRANRAKREAEAAAAEPVPDQQAA